MNNAATDRPFPTLEPTQPDPVWADNESMAAYYGQLALYYWGKVADARRFYSDNKARVYTSWAERAEQRGRCYQ